MSTSPGRTAPSLLTPSVARIEDHALGGVDHYPVDREVFARIVSAYPAYRAEPGVVQALKARTATAAAAAGVRQFLDLDAGILHGPTLHEVVQQVCSGARVVYVDSDPTAYAHGVLRTHGLVGAVAVRAGADGDVLALPGVRDALDLTEPVAVLAHSVLRFLDDRSVADLVGHLGRAAAPGSLLGFSAVAVAADDPRRHSLGCYAEGVRRCGRRLVVRTPAQVRRLLAPTVLLPPGLVDPQDWPIPGDPADRVPGLLSVAGVARVGDSDPSR